MYIEFEQIDGAAMSSDDHYSHGHPQAFVLPNMHVRARSLETVPSDSGDGVRLSLAQHREVRHD